MLFYSSASTSPKRPSGVPALIIGRGWTWSSMRAGMTLLLQLTRRASATPAAGCSRRTRQVERTGRDATSRATTCSLVVNRAVHHSRCTTGCDLGTTMITVSLCLWCQRHGASICQRLCPPRSLRRYANARHLKLLANESRVRILTRGDGCDVRVRCRRARRRVRVPDAPTSLSQAAGRRPQMAAATGSIRPACDACGLLRAGGKCEKVKQVHRDTKK